jgi:hypothetical protein
MGKRKSKRKKRRGIPWAGLFLLAAPILLLVFLFLPLKLSRLPLAQPVWEAWNRLGITAEKITVTPRGRLRAYQVRLGNPAAGRIAELHLDLSLLELLRGRIVFQRASGRSIQADWKRLPDFVDRLRREAPMRGLSPRISGFEFRGRGIQIDGLSSGPVSLERAVLDVDLKSGPKAKVSARDVRLGNLPAISSLSFGITGRAGNFRLEALRADWEGAEIRGDLAWDSSAALRGDLDFRNVDLGRLGARRLDSGQALEGMAAGTARFRLRPGDRNSLVASGKFSGKDLRLKDFPAQRDPLVRNHMPALQDARFRDFKVEEWRLRDGVLSLDSLAAEGAPISVQGRARIAFRTLPSPGDPAPWRGGVQMDLVGRLEEDYFQTLKPLVKSALYRDSSGQAAFKFRVTGDFQRQRVIPEKVFSRVVKSITSRFGRKVKNLVQPALEN